MKAQLGVLANATVKIYRLGSNQVRTLLYIEKTSNGDSLEKIGNFNGHIDVLEVDKFYLFEVEGGIDRDSNDDGILDVSGTVNYGTLRLIAKGSNLKVAKLARVTLASEMLYVQASKAILYDFENLESKLNSYIVDIIDEDLDGNGKIDMQDLLNFNPVTQASGLNNNYDMHAMTASILDNDLSYMNESNVSQVIGSYTIEDSDYYMSNLVLSPDGSTIYTIGSNYYRRYGLLSLDVTNKTSPKYLDNLNINIEQPKGITISNNGEKIFFADSRPHKQIAPSYHSFYLLRFGCD